MKTVIKWSDDLSVGVSALDDDHKKLIDILEQLFVASFAGVGAEQIDRTLQDLHHYTKHHFSREERVMEEYGFPSLEPHKFQHEKLIRQLDEIEARVKGEAEGNQEPSNELIDFLREWLIGHIQEYDHEYAAFLKEQGVDDPPVPAGAAHGG